ncbi:MAG: hypothetical protein HY318_05200 [Armatimonadetes bacterium]|nr:hypothetical protein [Armatimonadota bacterium]
MAEEPILQELRQLMADSLKVKIEHEEKIAPGADNKPPCKSESWTFHAGLARPVVRYGRYLNRPPDFTGSYPSLANSDMGIGFDGGAFGNWYRGNALRVFINDRDIFAGQPATKIEGREGENGRLGLVWELEERRSITLNIFVPEDGHAMYALLDLSLPGLKVDSIKAWVNCYPGGYGPAYGLPSHRWVTTAGNQAEVPEDFAAKEFPKVPITEDDAWIFYADTLENSGSLGLVVLPEEKVSGEVSLSSYGVGTTLNYPPETRHIHLGFFAYSIVNEAARRSFVNGIKEEMDRLRSVAILQQ